MARARLLVRRKGLVYTSCAMGVNKDRQANPFAVASFWS